MPWSLGIPNVSSLLHLVNDIKREKLLPKYFFWPKFCSLKQRKEKEKRTRRRRERGKRKQGAEKEENTFVLVYGKKKKKSAQHCAQTVKLNGKQRNGH